MTANLFETTFYDRALPAFQRAFGVQVTITDGQNTSDAFTGRRVKFDEEVRGEIFGYKIRRREYWLPVALVVINGATVAPRDGWKINEGDEVWQIRPFEAIAAVDLDEGGLQWVCQAVRIQQ